MDSMSSHPTVSLVNLTIAAAMHHLDHQQHHHPPFSDLFVSPSGALTSVASASSSSSSSFTSLSSSSTSGSPSSPASFSHGDPAVSTLSQLLYTLNASSLPAEFLLAATASASSSSSSLSSSVGGTSGGTLGTSTHDHQQQQQLRSLERLVEVSYLYRTLVAGIYFVTAFVAFIVNLFALLILFFGQRKSRQLNRFLSNLGFSDIIFSIFNIPFTYITLIYNTWWLPEFLCPLTSFVQVLAPTVAFYTLIAIGIGRYMVIVTGHESRMMTKSSRTKYVVTAIWLLAILMAAPMLYATRIRPVQYGNETFVECTEDWSGFFFFGAEAEDKQLNGTIYTVIVFVLTFILPVVTLTYLYGHIGFIVYKHQLPVGNDNRVTNRNLTKAKIKAVKMLLLLVISFIVCWSPCQIFYLLLWVFSDIRQDDTVVSSTTTTTSSTPTTGSTSAVWSANLTSIGNSGEQPMLDDEQSVGSMYSTIYYTAYFIFHWLSCSHTIINPFIYCFFSNNFQKSDLYAILSCNIETPGSRVSRKSISQYPGSTMNFNTATNHRESIRICGGGGGNGGGGDGGGGEVRRNSLLRKNHQMITYGGNGVDNGGGGKMIATSPTAITNANDSIVTLKYTAHGLANSQV